MPALAYLDCFSGVSGDMFLGALVDAGVALSDLEADLEALHLREFSLAAERVVRGGVAATKVTVAVASGAPRRGPREVKALIEASGLSDPVQRRAIAVFDRLAAAEAKVHNEPIDHVHFHEVGAVDAIVDVVGTCAGLARLGVNRLISAPVPVGRGQVRTAHGVLPVPAPATAELLKGVPIAPTDEEAELTTPTGAALLATLADSVGRFPAMRIERVGYGAGTRENRFLPNVLRLLVGEPADPAGGGADTVWLVQATLDDATGVVLGHLVERLLAAGAVDAYLTPVVMKKGRPGVVVTALAPPAALMAVEACLFAETPTFGLRRHAVTRQKLDREHVQVETPYGPVRVKVGRLAGEVLAAAPEYEDCRRLAEEKTVPLRSVLDAALETYRRGAGKQDGVLRR